MSVSSCCKLMCSCERCFLLPYDSLLSEPNDFPQDMDYAKDPFTGMSVSSIFATSLPPPSVFSRRHALMYQSNVMFAPIQIASAV